MAEFDAPVDQPKSLRETFDFLRQANERKAFLSLRPYVEPVQRNQVVDLLLAVDGFALANTTALQAAKRACPDYPEAQRRRLDLSGLLDTLELFSRHVEVVAEREDRTKGVAVVSIRVAGQATPQDVRFRLLDGRWVYVPGPQVEELTAAFLALTKALERVTRSLRLAGHMTPEAVAEQYQLFVAPTIKRISSGLSVR